MGLLYFPPKGRRHQANKGATAGDAGFTLIEVVIAGAIISVLILAFATSSVHLSTERRQGQIVINGETLMSRAHGALLSQIYLYATAMKNSPLDQCLMSGCPSNYNHAMDLYDPSGSHFLTNGYVNDSGTTCTHGTDASCVWQTTMTFDPYTNYATKTIIGAFGIPITVPIPPGPTQPGQKADTIVATYTLAYSPPNLPTVVKVPMKPRTISMTLGAEMFNLPPQASNCLPGNFMTGFSQNGNPVCKALPKSCQTNHYVIGYNTDGSLICSP